MENNEPEYIFTPNEITLIKKTRIQEITTKANQSHVNLAFDVLKKALHKMYGARYMDDPVSHLYNEANSDYKTFVIFSECVSETIASFPLAKNTCKSAFYALKKILRVIGFNENFVNRLNLHTEKPLTKYDPRRILKTSFSKMQDDSFIKKTLVEWIHILRTKTKNRSPQTIRIMISFFLNTCLPSLGLSIENFFIDENFTITQKAVNEICTNTRRYRWFNLFCDAILGIKNELKPSISIDSDDEREYTSGDKHVINSDELDRIYTEAKKNTLDELVFLLLITTGMRVGGMLNIKMQHVCCINGNDIRVFDTGRTLEKGGKWFDFVINDRVKELIVKWITNERKGSTDYLFSSSRNSQRNMATITIRVRFKKICENAGLNGSHLHLHSLRHSYAHMLLKCGNSVSVISKLLNHSCTDVTEKFYLRETISEVTNRAHIPWLNQNEQNRSKILPDFLTNKENKISHKMKRLEYLKTMC